MFQNHFKLTANTLKMMKYQILYYFAISYMSSYNEHTLGVILVGK